MPAGLLCSRFKMYRVSCGGCSISAAADGSGMSGYLVVYMGWTTTARRDESAIAGQNKKRPRKRKLMSDIFVKLVAISGHNKAAAAVATRFSRIHVHSTIFALAYDTHGREELHPMQRCTFWSHNLLLAKALVVAVGGKNIECLCNPLQVVSFKHILL